MSDQTAFDTEGAARYVGLSADVIRKAKRVGELPVYFPTSKPMFLRADLDAWVASWPTKPKVSR